MEAFESIQESGFIPAFFVTTSSKCIGLQPYIFYPPLKFDAMFEKYFLPLLSDKGITDIIVEQDTFKDEDDGYVYHVKIKSANVCYEFKEHDAQDLITPFVLAINRVLTDKPIKERFVRAIDFDVTFAFFEPNEIVACFAKYDLRVKAIDLYN
ncbi:hypothetical protein F0L74_06970 [Chitinophaga agrisoli]|uniref:Uncharacterized protein n=1 Tax=Chitinophaga agrisoli TaxID=2607653 RepID=A0A5B2W647_9BACT|nr:hypothetical protein [Chitinophaga agrisoli]KAA2245689.1 hypothetical protein F0L74_06970 [Chitinophaga agrisoli]